MRCQNVAGCIYTIEETKNTVNEVSKKYGVERVTLFGSYARGEARHDSDIDLRIDKGRIRGLFQLSGFYTDLEERLNVRVDVVVTDSLSKEFLQRISKEEILLYEYFSIDEIKSILLPVFQNAPVYRAILFGSYAKGSPTDKSDIDIVIDSRGELLNMEFYGILEDITTLLGKRVDLFEITELKNNTVMQSTIEQEGIVLYDRQG